MKCRVCECTDSDACMGGCSWVEADLCSTCAEAIMMLCEYYDAAGGSVRPGPVILQRFAEEAVRLIYDEQAEAALAEPRVVSGRA